jgi:hypothetical protein
MPTQPLLTPYTAAEVEDAAGLVALRKQQHDEALVGLGYAKAAAKEAQEALAQAFTDWLKARASYQAQQTADEGELLFDDVRAAISAAGGRGGE